MKLQTKVWLGTGAVIGVIMATDLVTGYQRINADIRERLDEDARIVRAILMATRRVYHAQFMASGLPVDERTVGFLPAHALSRISADFPNWINSGLRFNNVSDRPRNPGNQADAHELAAMEWFRANPKVADRVTEIRDTQGRAFYHFTAPIWIEPYCLNCHGAQAAAPASIRSTYDSAYGYRVGDLRGVMSIKLPMDQLRARAIDKWSETFLVRGAGYLLLMGLLGVLLQQLVTRRLSRLGTTAKRLQAGDLTARASLAGDDEVATLGRHFNEMATALAEHEAQVQRLTRIYAALSETNQAIVRVNSEEELLDRICRITVQYGGMRMAWIARPDAVAQCMTIACSFGEGATEFERIQISIDPSATNGRGPTATAWRTGEPVVIQDFLADPMTAPWHDFGRMMGWGSSGAFPIRRSDRVVLVLSIYHPEAHAFDARICDLLAEMAMDIGYALDRMDLERAQQQTHAALRENETKYRTVIETSQDGFWLADGTGRLQEVNNAYVHLSGYTREELLTMRIADLEATELEDRVTAHMAYIRKHGGDRFETRHRTKSGEIRDVEVSVTFSARHGGRFSAFIRDLSKRKEAEARIQHLSHFDALTGLPNRLLLADRIQHAIAAAQRANEMLALIFLDLDHFRNINDSLGHRVGDQLLIELARRFATVLREDDTVARLGGDEFLILLPHVTMQTVTHLAERILQNIAESHTIDGNELTVTPSMGIAIYPTDGEDFETLLRCADTATNRAKLEGRNGYRFFTPEMQARSVRALQLEAGLRKALERNELLLHYQPQIDLRGGSVIGVEALVRWRHPELGLVSPAEFIPLAEESGMILPVGEWVLRTACRQMQDWLVQGLPLQGVAVNLSAVQFRQPDLPDVVARILAETGLPAGALELELTESATTDDPDDAVAMMDALHALGVHTSIDDFGTGYSSLSYLKRFRVDKLKIDQSFVRDLGKDPEDEAIVQAIVRLAQTLRFTTIAEGVETAEQLHLLRAFGCEEIQGYYFSRPLPADELAAWITQWRPEQTRG